MLEWFVSSTIAEKCLTRGEIITEELVECRPERVSNSCLDENVDIFLIKKHFTFDAWQVILHSIEQKKEQNDWFCTICSHDLQDSTSILCDCCLCWFHLSCVGLRNVPKQKEWFCRFCFDRISSENILNKSVGLSKPAMRFSFILLCSFNLQMVIAQTTRLIVQ